MWSLGFSRFRHLMDLWDGVVQRENNVQAIIDGNGLIVFFLKDGDVYGAPEEGRLVFAKMKNPDEEDEEDWATEASFAAFRLKDALEGREIARVFQQKDLKTLKVISQEKAVELLTTKKKTTPAKLNKVHGKDGAGIIQIKDRKK